MRKAIRSLAPVLLAAMAPGQEQPPMKSKPPAPGIVRPAAATDGKGMRRSRRKIRRRPELMPMAQPSAGAAPLQPAAGETPAPAQNKTGPGVTLGGGFRACIPGDPTPPGTVIEGYRKLVSDTPFGKACRWELVR